MDLVITLDIHLRTEPDESVQEAVERLKNNLDWAGFDYYPVMEVRNEEGKLIE